MSVVAIRAALDARLNTINPSLATAWENAAFVKPAATVPYQVVHLLFATPDNPETGTGYRELGYMQVTLCYVLQAGPGAAAARAKVVRDTFPKNLSLASGTTIVTISKTPSIGNGMVDGDRFTLPVKIPFYANFFG